MNLKVSLIIPVFNESNEIDNFFNELKILKAHKELEHRFVYKKLIDYLY